MLLHGLKKKIWAGEILLTSMDRDGTKKGFDLDLTKKISESVSIPVVASGGVTDLIILLMVLKRVRHPLYSLPLYFILENYRSMKLKNI